MHTLYSPPPKKITKSQKVQFFLPKISGVARAFPGGRVAHPAGQNEEENK